MIIHPSQSLCCHMTSTFTGTDVVFETLAEKTDDVVLLGKTITPQRWFMTRLSGSSSVFLHFSFPSEHKVTSSLSLFFLSFLSYVNLLTAGSEQHGCSVLLYNLKIKCLWIQFYFHSFVRRMLLFKAAGNRRHNARRSRSRRNQHYMCNIENGTRWICRSQ